MEQYSRLQHAFHPFKDGRLATKLLRNWRDASSVDGLSRVRKVNDDWAFLGLAAAGEGGFPYPRIGSRAQLSDQDGAQYKKNNRTPSSDTESSSE